MQKKYPALYTHIEKQYDRLHRRCCFNWDAESIRISQEEQLKRAREKAMAEGRAEGKAQGEAKVKAEVIKNLLSSNKFSISEIAKLSNVTVKFVNEIQAEIAKGK